MRKVLIVIGAVFALLVAGGIGYAIGGGNEKEEPPVVTEEPDIPWTGETPEGTTTPEPEPQPEPTSDRLDGLNLTAYTPEGYVSPKARAAVQKLADIGSTSVTIIPTWYMKNSSANRIAPNKKKTPSDTSLDTVTSWAREAGMKVIFKPHVDVIDDTFRGDIQPADRAAWFKSYETFIGRYADLAANNGADLFSVGTELKSLSGDTDPWKKIIEGVRGKFGGQLTYAANWDEVEQVQFWDSLDLIGVDPYYPLSSEGQVPTEDELVTAWQTPISSLEATSTKWGKNVIFTEIGYPTQANATAHPFEVRQGEPADQQAQAVAYRAAFSAFAGLPWFEGMNWWSWRADPSKGENLKIDYTPQGKEAENVLIQNQTD